MFFGVLSVLLTKPVSKRQNRSKRGPNPYAKVSKRAKPSIPGFMENTENNVFIDFRHKRIISKSQSAANNRILDKTAKNTKIEPEWVGVLDKMTKTDTVHDNTRGNRF